MSGLFVQTLLNVLSALAVFMGGSGVFVVWHDGWRFEITIRPIDAANGEPNAPAAGEPTPARALEVAEALVRAARGER